jgi:hypothetical protein
MNGRPEKKVRDHVTVPPIIKELNFYGRHRHFNAAGSVLIFGGDLKKGYLHGETATERTVTTVNDRRPAQLELSCAGNLTPSGLRGQAATVLCQAR